MFYDSPPNRVVEFSTHVGNRQINVQVAKVNDTRYLCLFNWKGGTVLLDRTEMLELSAALDKVTWVDPPEPLNSLLVHLPKELHHTIASELRYRLHLIISEWFSLGLSAE